MALAKKILFLVILSAFLIACKTAPLENVHDGVLDTPRGTSLNDVTNSIVRAGNGLGWQMKKVKPGMIVGTLYLRKHMAQVNITYDTKSYNIDYRNSSNLNYNKTDSNYDGQTSIHPNYNGWVKNLSRAINNQVYSIN